VPRIITHAGDVSIAGPDILELRLRDCRATDLRWIVKVGAKERQQVLAISLRVDILRIPASPQFGRARFDVGGATSERHGKHDQQRQCSLSPTRHSLDPRFRATIIAGGGAASEGHALSAERMYAAQDSLREDVMTLTRRTLVLAGLAAPLAAPGVARSQSWPSGPLRIVVAYPPGGSTDAIMRLVQPGMQQRLGATVVIENRSGASGSVGTAAVVKSPPDGNTWLAVFDNHAANPCVLPGLPYDTEKDLDPVLLIGTAPYMISTAAAKPYKTLADVLSFAKDNPGKVSYGSGRRRAARDPPRRLLLPDTGV